MPVAPSTLARLDIASPRGMRGLLFGLRWALAGPDRRNRQMLRILWDMHSWKDTPSTAASLGKMRQLIDLGVTHRPLPGVDLLHRLSTRAHVGQRALLGWEALRSIRDKLPVDAVHLLLDAGAPVDFRESNNYSDSLLTCAVRHGHLAAARLLISAGATLDIVDTCDTSPLRLAVQRFKGSESADDAAEREALSLVKCLLQAGATVDYADVHFKGSVSHKDAPPSPLLEAAGLGWEAGVECLLQAGARPTQVGEVSGAGFAQKWTEEVVHWNDYPTGKRQHHARAMLERLVKAGMQVHQPAKDGTTALFRAVSAGQFDLALALMDHGAIPHPGPTPFPHLLIQRNIDHDPPAEAFLARMPPDFWQQRNNDGWTAQQCLQNDHADGRLRDYQRRWLARLQSQDLSADTPTPSQVRPRPRL